MHDRLTVRPHRVVFLRVTKRQQTLGALAALAVAIFYAFALPALSNVSDGDSGFTAGEPFAAVDGVTIVPAAEWSITGQGAFLSTMSRGPATLAIVAAAPITEDSSQTLDNIVSGLESDSERQWVIGDPESGSTDAGDDFVTVVAHAFDEVSQVWVIDNGSVTTTVVATVPDGLWIQYESDIDGMVLSVRFVDGS